MLVVWSLLTSNIKIIGLAIQTVLIAPTQKISYTFVYIILHDTSSLLSSISEYSSICVSINNCTKISISNSIRVCVGVA